MKYHVSPPSAASAAAITASIVATLLLGVCESNIFDTPLGENQPPPSRDSVNEFMTVARQAAVVEADSKQRIRIEVRENSSAVSLESRPADATANAWVHRSYIAK